MAHSNTNNEFNTVGWSLAFNSNEYIYFTLTPDPNYWINITSFNFSGNTSVSGPTNFILRSSLDNFNSDIGTIGASGNVSFNTAYTHLTSTVTFRIYAFGATSSNGAFGITSFSFNGSVALPIQLSSFDILLLNGRPIITWATLAEQNNHYYSLERSADAKDFAQIKKIYGFGSGTTDKKTEYHHIDPTPLPGINYYRLRQADLDGTETVYPTKSIFIKPVKTIVFPTMFDERLSILFSNPPSATNQWKLINMNGQLISQGQIIGQSLLHEINVDHAAPGVYIFVIFDKVRTEAFTLFRQ